MSSSLTTEGLMMHPVYDCRFRRESVTKMLADSR